MKTAAWTLLIVMTLTTRVDAHDACKKAQCAEVKAKISNIQSRMRSGYSRSQGERMEAELRKLRARRGKLCR